MRKRYNICITPEIQEHGTKIAARREISLSRLIERLLKREIRRSQEAGK